MIVPRVLRELAAHTRRRHPGEEGVRRGGLQPERTALSWQRTGLSAAMVTLVTALAGLRVGVPIVAIVAALAAATTAGMALVHFPRGALDARGRTRPWPTLLRVASLVVLTGVLGAIVGIARIVGVGE